MVEIINVIEQMRTIQKPLRKGTKEADEVLNKLKDLLNQDKQQSWLSMCLLSCVVKLADKEIFENNALFWLKSSMKIINLLPSENVLGLCYEIVIDVLIKGHQIDKISREIATKGIEPLMLILFNELLPTIPIVYKVITSCLKYYGGACSKQRVKLELFILKGSVSKEKDVSRTSCSAFPYLVLCGNGGDHHSKHIENWNTMFNKTVKTIYTNYTDLLNSNMVELENRTNLLSFPPQHDKTDNLSKDFFFLHIERSIQLLTSLLSHSMPFTINLPLPLCVSLLTKISTLLSLDLKVYNFYTKIDVEVLLINIIINFLDCIIILCKQFSLLCAPYTKALSKIVFDSLSSPFVIDRAKSYFAFSSLIKGAFVSPINCSVFDDFLELLLKDISTKTTLVRPAIVTKGKSKKRSFHDTLYSQDIDKAAANSRWQNCNDLAERSTKAALSCLEDVIVYTGPLLSTSLMQLILTQMFSVCKALYGNNDNAAGRYSVETRYFIFKVLKALFLLHHQHVQVPRNVLLSLFQTGITDPSEKVAEFCKQKLYFSEQILHNSSPEFRINPKLFCLERSSSEISNEDIEMEIRETQNPVTTPVSSAKPYDSSDERSYQQQNQQQQIGVNTSQHETTNTTKSSINQEPREQPKEIMNPTTSSISTNFTSSEKQISRSADHVLQKQRSPILAAQRSKSDPGRIDIMSGVDPSPANTDNDVVLVVNISDDEENVASENHSLQSPAKKPHIGPTTSNNIDFEFSINLCKKSTKTVNENDKSSGLNSCGTNDSIGENVNGEEAMVISEEDQEFQDIISTFQEVYAE